MQIKITKSPTGAIVKLRRTEAGLTQVEAADLVHKSLGSYKRYEQGRSTMARCTWELFMIKTEKHVRRARKLKESSQHNFLPL